MTRSLMLTAVLLVMAVRAFADPTPTVLAVGDTLPALALRDQNDVDVRIDAATRMVLFTRDMGGGGIVKEALAKGGQDTLAGARAVYVSDVSGMPSLVRSAFALPGLRKRAYSVALDEGGEVTRTLPFRAGKVTVLALAAGKITAIGFAATSADLAAVLRP
jgi:hypothetical protein